MVQVVKNLLQSICLALLVHPLVSAGEEGCSAPPLLPDLPFFVVWNHPSGGCEKRGIDLGLDKWVGIVENDKDAFLGEQISLFYSLGLWPYLEGSKKVNGGLPQLGNLSAHLAKAKEDATNTLKENFTGLSVIDFESWRPLFGLNFDSLSKYQVLSIALAKQRHPSMNHSQLHAEAAREFQGAARSFMGDTLMEMSSLRPKGKWGYYGYPRCWGSNCTEHTASTNDKMSWIFKHSTGLYPSIYFNSKYSPAKSINHTLRETFRLKAKFSRQDVVVFPYAESQSGAYGMYNVTTLSYAIGLPADMGASGVVLWGSSGAMRAKNECLVLQQWINSTLGPYVQNITKFFSACSQDNCEGHGRCIRKDYEVIYQRHLLESGRTDCSIPVDKLERKKKSIKTQANKEENHFKMKFDSTDLNFEPEDLLMSGGNDEETYTLTYDFDDYVCKCYAGWSGAHCNQRVRH